MSVAVTGAAHESGRADDEAFRQTGKNFFAPQSVLRRNDRALIESLRYRRKCRFGLSGLRGNDSEIKFRQTVGIGRGVQVRSKAVLSGNLQSFPIQSLSMFCTSHERPNFGHTRE